MFVGHVGLAFAAKKAAPRPSLGTLALAADLVAGTALAGWLSVV